MKIKKFKCGLCKEEKRFWMTKKNLRKHLKSEHGVKNNLINKIDPTNKKIIGYYNYVIEEECE